MPLRLSFQLPDHRGRGPPLDADHDQLADARIRPVGHHRGIGPRVAGHLPPPVPAFDQDFYRPPDPALKPAERDLRLQFKKRAVAALLYGPRHVIDTAGRLGSGPRRVLEDEGAVVLDALHERPRRLEVVVGLTGETDDDVRRKGDRRHERPEPGDLGQITLRRVPPAHRPQDLIGAGLNREMQGLADRWTLRHRLKEPLVGVEWMACRELDARNRALLIDRAEKDGEIDEPRGLLFTGRFGLLPEE